MKEKTAWFIACGFLAGYIFAWGAIALDRHLIVEAQRELQQELVQLRQELRLRDIVDEASLEMSRHMEWNRKALQKSPTPEHLLPKKKVEK